LGRRRSRLIAALLALLGASGTAGADCAADLVELRNAAGQIQRFHVEVADDPDEQSKGLMFREKMAMSAGMLFVFPQEKHATFWMKNTLLPLDMIFADAKGRVTRVHPDAVPLDETMIDGGAGVRFVLEINAGLAAPMGIKPGAVLRHPAVSGDEAVWACDAP
jgi:uncharacterized protein